MDNVNKQLKNLVEHSGWKIAKERADEIIRDMTDMRKLPDNIEDKAKEIDIRTGAVSLFEQWINDITSSSELAENDIPADEEDNLIILKV